MKHLHKLLLFAIPLLIVFPATGVTQVRPLKTSIQPNGSNQQPELIVPTRPLISSIQAIAYSPDGKALATAGDQQIITIWDVNTGRVLRNLEGHSNDISALTYSPDGKFLASGSDDKTIKLWDANTGHEIRTFAGTLFSHSLAFSPNSRILVGASDEPNHAFIKLWEVATGKEIKRFQTAGADFAFSPDGKTLTVRRDYREALKVWDVDTGRELCAIEIPPNQTLLAIEYSLNSKVLAVVLDNQTIKLFNAATGVEIIKINADVDYINCIKFSPDSRFLAAGLRMDTNSKAAKGKTEGRIKIWEVATGREIYTFDGYVDSVWSLAFSPDGSTLVGGGGGLVSLGEIKLWNVATGKEVRAFTTRISYTFFIDISPNGRMLALPIADTLSMLGSLDGDKLDVKKFREANTGGIRLTDLATGKDVQLFDDSTAIVVRVAFGDVGHLLAEFCGSLKDNGEIEAKVVIKDVSTGKDVRVFAVGEKADGFAFASDGKTVATATDDEKHDIAVWDVETGRKRFNVIGDAPISFSANGKSLVGREKNNIAFWDAITGDKLKTIEHSKQLDAIALSPDGKLLAGADTSTIDGVDIHVWSLPSGRELHTFKEHKEIGVSSLCFSQDSRKLAIGGMSIKVLDMKMGEELGAFREVSAPSSVKFSADGNILIVSSLAGKIIFWEIASGKILVELLLFNHKDWLIITPEGLFDGSPGAWDQILWRFSPNLFDVAPVEAYFTDFYYPGLLTDIFAGKRPKAPSDITEKDRRRPQLTLTLPDAQPETSLTAREVTVNVEVSQAPAGAQDVRLFRNGSLVKVWHGDVLKGRDRVMLQATVSIAAGVNRLTAYAFNKENIKSSDSTIVVNGAQSLSRQGTAYILAVGVGRYSNPQYDLKYTVPDSQAFSEEIKYQQSTLRNYKQIEIISLVDNEATKANILNKLAQLAVRAQPEDAIIIYFSGHGTAQGSSFYLIPHDLGYLGQRDKLDAASLRTILTHSISDRELEAAFEQIDAGQIMLIIDACNSGQALEAEEKRRGPMNSKGLAQLAYEKGMYVLTASQSYELAFESNALKNSYLTYALIKEGLQSRIKETDANGDGYIWLREWFDYAEQRVPHMREEKIEQRAGRKNKALDLAETLATRKVQTPRAFYRSWPDARPWVVARLN